MAYRQDGAMVRTQPLPAVTRLSGGHAQLTPTTKCIKLLLLSGPPSGQQTIVTHLVSLWGGGMSRAILTEHRETLPDR